MFPPPSHSTERLREVATSKACLLESRPAEVGSRMGREVPPDRAPKGTGRSGVVASVVLHKAHFTRIPLQSQVGEVFDLGPKEEL
jgi:hypothetical protein